MAAHLRGPHPGHHGGLEQVIHVRKIGEGINCQMYSSDLFIKKENAVSVSAKEIARWLTSSLPVSSVTKTT